MKIISKTEIIILVLSIALAFIFQDTKIENTTDTEAQFKTQYFFKDEFNGSELNPEKWGFFTDIHPGRQPPHDHYSRADIVNNTLRLYDDRFIVGEIPWHSSQGITIYSRKNDADDGILEFDYGNLIRGSTADYATIVVNFNSNDFSHPDGFFKPNTGYRLRITADAPKDMVILQEVHNKDVKKEQRIESSVDILAAGHIKIIKHNGSFTIFYNSTYQTETLVGNITILTYLPPGRFGFSVGTLEGRYIELDNVTFTSL